MVALLQQSRDVNVIPENHLSFAARRI